MPRMTAEQIFRGFLRGSPTIDTASKANQFSGITRIDSGTATVTVSTTAVQSDSFFHLAQAVITGPLSGKAIEVKSINPGNAFVIGAVDQVAIPGTRDVHWLIFKTS